MVTLTSWTAHTSWKRIGDLQQRLTVVQMQSFQIAGHFQRTILELNNLVLRYAVSREEPDWAHFDSSSQVLDHWIDEQRPMLPTEKEKQILDQINSVYDDYLAAASQQQQQQ